MYVNNAQIFGVSKSFKNKLIIVSHKDTLHWLYTEVTVNTIIIIQNIFYFI